MGKIYTALNVTFIIKSSLYICTFVVPTIQINWRKSNVISCIQGIHTDSEILETVKQNKVPLSFGTKKWVGTWDFKVKECNSQEDVRVNIW